MPISTVTSPFDLTVNKTSNSVDLSQDNGTHVVHVSYKCVLETQITVYWCVSKTKLTAVLEAVGSGDNEGQKGQFVLEYSMYKHMTRVLSSEYVVC